MGLLPSGRNDARPVHADLGKSNGASVLCASHSPLLTAMPGATILELGDYGYRKRSWADLELVDHWKQYLADPQAYLHHVLD